MLVLGLWRCLSCFGLENMSECQELGAHTDCNALKQDATLIACDILYQLSSHLLL